MPYTTLVAGTTITAAWANANVRDQAVSQFATSAARDAAITAPVEGMVAHRNDTNQLTAYSGSAWCGTGPVSGVSIAFVPGLAGITIGNGTVVGSYVKLGRWVTWRGRLTFGSTTIVTGGIGFGLPDTSESLGVDGSSWAVAFDSSANARYMLAAFSVSTTSIVFATTASPWVTTSATVPFTWANGDVLQVYSMFESSTDN